MTTANANSVTYIFQYMAGGLTPTAADLAYYTTQMDNGWTASQVAAAFENTAFIQNAVNPLIREYQAAFGRVPDQAGLAYWIGQIAPHGAGGDLNTGVLSNLNTIFAGSTEFQTRYGSTLDPSTVLTPANGTALVNGMYNNVLLRTADAAGLNYWLNAHVTVHDMLQSFAQSAEFVNTAATSVSSFETAEALGSPYTSGSLFSPDAPFGNAGGTNYDMYNGYY